MGKSMVLVVSCAVLAMAAGCASSAEEHVAPGVDAVDELQTIYSTNADGTWSATANKPSHPTNSVARGSATFTGPSGKTRRMGVCILAQATSTTCTTTANCPAPPAGGSMYCTAPDGVGSKYCFVRNGSQSGYCAGSPALGGAAVAPGTYTTPSVAATNGSTWISYACFEGCAVTDPSSSSLAYVVCNPSQIKLDACNSTGGYFDTETCTCVV